MTTFSGPNMSWITTGLNRKDRGPEEMLVTPSLSEYLLSAYYGTDTIPSLGKVTENKTQNLPFRCYSSEGKIDGK